MAGLQGHKAASSICLNTKTSWPLIICSHKPAAACVSHGRLDQIYHMHIKSCLTTPKGKINLLFFFFPKILIVTQQVNSYILQVMLFHFVKQSPAHWREHLGSEDRYHLLQLGSEKSSSLLSNVQFEEHMPTMQWRTILLPPGISIQESTCSTKNHSASTKQLRCRPKMVSNSCGYNELCWLSI